MAPSGAAARYLPHGGRVQAILIPLMIAGCVLSSGVTVLIPRSARQVDGPLKDLHPGRQTLQRWKKHFEDYGETPHETQVHEARRVGLQKCTAATKAVVRSLRRAVKDQPEYMYYLDEFKDYVLDDLGYAPRFPTRGRIRARATSRTKRSSCARGGAAASRSTACWGRCFA